MLPKSYRLKKKEVERVYKKGRVIPQGLFLIRIFPNRASHARFAIVVPKKVLAKATERNRLRRIVFESISKNKTLWEKNAWDLVLAVKGQIEEDKIDVLLKNVFTGLK